MGIHRCRGLSKYSFAVLVAIFLFSVDARPIHANAACPSLFETIRELKKQGVSAADRRRAVLPKLSATTVRARFDDAKKSGKKEIYLPELVPDVRWALASLKERHDAAIRKSPFTPEQINHLEEAAEFYRLRFSSILDDPRGVPMRDWLALSEDYVVFTEYLDNIAQIAGQPKIHRSVIANKGQIDGNVSFYMRDPIKIEDKYLFYRSYEEGDIIVNPSKWEPEGWVGVPTARDFDIAELNEWMSEGVMPIGVTDRRVSFDGANESAWGFFDHDRIHLDDVPPYNTRIPGFSPKSYFELFRKFGAQFRDTMTQKNLEVIWFYFYHELGPNRGIYSYNPSDLIKSVADPRQRDRVVRGIVSRIQSKDDLGSFYGDQLPTVKHIDEALDELLHFAKNLEKDKTIPALPLTPAQN